MPLGRDKIITIKAVNLTHMLNWELILRGEFRDHPIL